MLFLNRFDAGEKLSHRLLNFLPENVIILGIPRGGVVVAAPIAKALQTAIDVIVPRKIGAPHNSEVAIGAVCQDGTVIKDHRIIELLGISGSQFDGLAKKVLQEIQRRVDKYRNGREGIALAGKKVVIVDDGIATGYTIEAAIKSVRRLNATSITLGVPVAPLEVADRLEKSVDDLICLEKAVDFHAVGQFYVNFDQTTDQEVIDILTSYRDSNKLRWP